MSAQTGHNVKLVDLSDDLLQRADKRIRGSLQRVAKKQFHEDPQVQVVYKCIVITLYHIPHYSHQQYNTFQNFALMRSG